MNFDIKEWIEIANILSLKFPSFLFIFLSHPKGNIPNLKNNKNIIIFQNNNDLLNLVELISRLDFLISVDTGNVHIADNLKIPTLEIISKSTKNQWCGGAYGGFCKAMSLPQKWSKNRQKYISDFLTQASLCLKNLNNL